MRLSFFAVSSTLMLLFPACGGGASVDVSGGESVYRQPLSDGNSFACATCHALTDTDGTGRRAAHPIGGAASRGSWKNGDAKTFLDAVNVCVTGWQGAAAWQASDERFVALSDFLATQGDAASEAKLTFHLVAPPSSLSGGDSVRGRAVFNEACSTCHGLDGVGSVRGPNVGGTGQAPAYVASRVRGMPLVGRMPFFSEERMSDGELLDVIAWLALRTERDAGTATEPDAGTTGSADAGTMPSCGADHPHVGWTTMLQTRAHGVTGRLTATSNCTLELTGFSYDGNGIDVRLYGARTLASLGSGIALGPQLYRPGTPWSNAHLTIDLPAGKTLDDVSALSVWCVAVGVSFGDGVLHAP